MKKHLRHARTVAIVLVSIALITLTVSVLMLQEEAVADPIEPTPADLATALHRVDLDPPALAAVGLSTGQVTSLVQSVRQHLIDHPGSLTQADQSAADLQRSHDALKRLIQSGQATQEDLGNFATVQGALSLARVAQQDELNELFDAGTAALSAETKSRLSQIRANDEWKLPTEFLVVSRTQEASLHLRNALANERISADAGEEIDPAAEAILQDARSDPAVSLAKGSLDANLAPVTAAWEQEIGLP